MALITASCEDQYKKFPELDRDEVLKLQKWQEEQPHLPNITELESIIFIYACNYDIEKAKQCSETYYTVRSHCPEFFAKRDVFGEDIKARMKVSGVTLLPGLTKEGYQVILCKMLDCDASKFDYIHTIKFYYMLLEIWLARDGPAEGYAFVMDMEGLTMSHMTKVNIAAMRKNLYYVQEALPIRLKASHSINIPPFMDKLMAMVRPFMKKELLDTIHIHQTLDSFFEQVPKSMMPDEYGGSAGKLDEIIEKGYQELRDNSQFFIDDEQTKRVNEELRPGKPKTDRDVFGYLLSWLSNMTIKQVE